MFNVVVPSNSQTKSRTRSASACYWPAETLESFTLQMSARGMCVSASMMLGDRDYAREQLRHAYTLKDERLQTLAQEMWSFFTDVALPAGATH